MSPHHCCRSILSPSTLPQSTLTCYFPFFFFFFKTGFLCSAGCPGTHSETRLPSNSQRSTCLWPLRAGIKGVCQCTQHLIIFKLLKNLLQQPHLSPLGPSTPHPWWKCKKSQDIRASARQACLECLPAPAWIGADVDPDITTLTSFQDREENWHKTQKELRKRG